jgi:hypothetical protein
MSSLFIPVPDQIVDDEIICMVCHDPIGGDFIRLHECGKLFCYGCWDKLVSCPNCRGDRLIYTSILPLSIKQKLNEIKMRCTHCSAEMNRSLTKDHTLKECPSLCTLCEQTFIGTKSLQEHKCPKKKVKCDKTYKGDEYRVSSELLFKTSNRECKWEGFEPELNSHECIVNVKYMFDEFHFSLSAYVAGKAPVALNTLIKGKKYRSTLQSRKRKRTKECKLVKYESSLICYCGFMGSTEELCNHITEEYLCECGGINHCPMEHPDKEDEPVAKVEKNSNSNTDQNNNNNSSIDLC